MHGRHSVSNWRLSKHGLFDRWQILQRAMRQCSSYWSRPHQRPGSQGHQLMSELLHPLLGLLRYGCLQSYEYLLPTRTDLTYSYCCSCYNLELRYPSCLDLQHRSLCGYRHKRRNRVFDRDYHYSNHHRVRIYHHKLGYFLFFFVFVFDRVFSGNDISNSLYLGLFYNTSCRSPGIGGYADFDLCQRVFERLYHYLCLPTDTHNLHSEPFYSRAVSKWYLYTGHKNVRSAL